MKKFIIPSIDLLDGEIVRLYQGSYENSIKYDIKIDELLDKYKNFENLHIVDLNGAKGDGMTNLSIIKEIRKYFKGFIQLGGGIRSVEIAQNIFNIGIDRVVIGTLAIKDFESTSNIIKKYSSEKIVLALDCIMEAGKFMLKSDGWQGDSKIDLFECLAKYQDIARYILITDISVDGTMNGANIDLYHEVKKIFPNFKIQASGGVGDVNDIIKLQNVTNYAIVGKALYNGLLDDLC